MKHRSQKQNLPSLREIFSQLRWLSRYCLRYKGQVAVYGLLGILGTAASLAGSILSKYIIDVVTGTDQGGILAALVFYVLMQLVRILLGALSGRISTRISIRVNQQITAQVYDKLMAAQWQPLSAYHSGDLLTRINGDVTTVSGSVLSWFPDLITRLLQLIGSLGVIVYYDYTLALPALTGAAVTLLLSRQILRKMQGHSQKMRQLTSEMTVFREESFRNIQLLKAFDRTDTYRGKHHTLLQSYRNAALEYNLFSLRKNALLAFVGTAVSMLCFCWCIYRLGSKDITPGIMAMFLQLAATLNGAFSALATLIPSGIHATTAAGRVMALMDLPEEDRTAAEEAADFSLQYKDTPLEIKGEHLTCSYRQDAPVLTDTEFHACPGELVTLVGPSGQGKTTLLRLLLGMLQPQEGTLQILAKDGKTLPVSAATRQLFAYVPQENSMFTGTVRENLLLIRPDASDEQLYRALSLACAGDFVRQLPQGLDTEIREQGGLSQGQLQRLSIARALLSDAPILLMDEATSALDPDTERRVLENIMSARGNRTCIVTTHSPGLLCYSDRIYRVADGKILPVSDPETMI